MKTAWEWWLNLSRHCFTWSLGEGAGVFCDPGGFPFLRNYDHYYCHHLLWRGRFVDSWWKVFFSRVEVEIFLWAVCSGAEHRSLCSVCSPECVQKPESIFIASRRVVCEYHQCRAYKLDLRQPASMPQGNHLVAHTTLHTWPPVDGGYYRWIGRYPPGCGYTALGVT